MDNLKKNVLLSIEEHVTFGHTDFSTKLESSKKASRSSLIFLAKKTLAPLSPQPTEIGVLRVTRRTIFPPAPALQARTLGASVSQHRGFAGLRRESPTPRCLLLLGWLLGKHDQFHSMLQL